MTAAFFFFVDQMHLFHECTFVIIVSIILLGLYIALGDSQLKKRREILLLISGVIIFGMLQLFSIQSPSDSLTEVPDFSHSIQLLATGFAEIQLSKSRSFH